MQTCGAAFNITSAIKCSPRRSRKSLDHAMLADHIQATSFPTVAGELTFGRDGEWKKSRQFVTQFQNITGNDVSQFRIQPAA
jgi:hypothetical protein